MFKGRLQTEMQKLLMPQATTWETIVCQGDEDEFLDRAESFLRARFCMNDPGSISKGAHILSKVCPFSFSALVSK
jgi:hypothetical protein